MKLLYIVGYNYVFGSSLGPVASMSSSGRAVSGAGMAWRQNRGMGGYRRTVVAALGNLGPVLRQSSTVRLIRRADHGIEDRGRQVKLLTELSVDQ